MFEIMKGKTPEKTSKPGEQASQKGRRREGDAKRWRREMEKRDGEERSRKEDVWLSI